MKTFISVVIAALIGLGAGAIAAWFYTAQPAQPQPKLTGFDLGICTPTESILTIGNQAPTVILATSSLRQWAIMQQPINATNTVSLSVSGTTTTAGVSARGGFQLTPATSTSPVEEWAIGFATQFRTQAPVRALTSTGSTTIKVIDCK